MARHRFTKDWTHQISPVQSRTFKAGSVRDDLDPKLLAAARKAGAIEEITSTGAVVAAPKAVPAPVGTGQPKAQETDTGQPKAQA